MHRRPTDDVMDRLDGSAPIRRYQRRGGYRATLTLLAAAALIAAVQCTRQRIERANELLQAGDFRAARKIYSRVVAKQPDNFDAHYGMGLSYCAEAMYKTGLGTARADDWYPAIYHVTVASNLGAESAEVRRTLAILHFNLGACHKKAGDHDAAIERIEQAVGYDSTLLKGYNLLGALYHEKADFVRAARCYERTLAIDPGYAMARFNLGALAWAQGDYDGAAEQFAKADSLAPGNAYFVEWLTKARSRTAVP